MTEPMGLMVDVTGASLPGLLAALGKNWPDTLGGYVTGADGVDWPATYWTILAGGTGLFRYDQSPQLGLFAYGAADCAAVERGAGTLEAAVSGAQKREAHGWYSWIYVSAGSLAGARSAAAGAKLARVRYVVADWNLSAAAAAVFIERNPDTDAVQWASPTSNPDTVCSGSQRTLAELNCDLSVTRHGWFARKPASLSGREGVIVTEPGLATARVASEDGRTWTVTS